MEYLTGAVMLKTWSFRGIVHRKMKMYSSSSHPRCRWVCFFIGIDFTSLVHLCILCSQGRNHGIDIGGVQMWALPQIFFLRLVADQIVKTNRPVHQRMNRGLSMEWEVRELLGLWLQQLFSLFSGYNASYLAVILSHLNVILFHIYSKISAVFLTMALLFRCLLAYRLKKGECPPVRPASFF